MYLQRSLHFVVAFALVMGTSAITNSYASATTTTSVAPMMQAARAQTVGSVPLLGPAPSVKREVFGFALASSLGNSTFGYSTWNFSLLSTVAFFGLHVNSGGAIVSDSGLGIWNSSTLTGLLRTAHGHGTKVVLTIVLQDFQPGTPNMCAVLINRSVTVRQAVAQVVAKGADGLNVDYEGLNGTCGNGQTSQAMLTDFVRQLRAALPSGAYLSVDTYASSAADPYGFFDIRSLNAYVDSFFVMAYDLEYSNYRYFPVSCLRFCLGPTAPLAGYHFNDTTTASQYASTVSPSKVILGVPYYGRKSCVGGAVANAYPATSVVADTYLDASGESSAPAVSRFAAHRDANDPAGRERWDTWFNSSMGCTRELYWDDVTSLGAKYDLVNADNLRGVGIWALNYGGGAAELWSALSSHFVSCAGVGLSLSPAARAVIGATVTASAAGAGCPDLNPLYQFFILTPGATSWKVSQPYSTKSTFTWGTAGEPPGVYRVAVWVRDSRSRGVFSNAFGAWDVSSSVPYGLISIPCSAAAISLGVSATPGVGVTVTAHSSGCPQPLYQFWIRAPGSTSYQVVQAYSPAAQWRWNTTGAPPGSYVIALWARDTSSLGGSGNGLGRWDAFAATRFTPPCSSVTLAPPGMAPAGSVVTVAARAVGCANPMYEFWVLAPGAGSWQMVRGYSNNSTLVWTTTGLAKGTYVVAVWAKDSNSSGASGNSAGRWDAFAATNAVLR